MTEAIKQWVDDEWGKHYDADFGDGLTKGIEIAEGFCEWVDGSPYFIFGPNNWKHVSSDQPNLTTSQLLEKYISHLEALNKEK